MPSSLRLSAAELRSLVTDGDLGEIIELLLNHPALLPCFLHFSSICRTLHRLELLHSEMQNDLHTVFADMTRNNLDDAFAFFIARKRQERQHAQPPLYSQTPPRFRRVHFRTQGTPSSNAQSSLSTTASSASSISLSIPSRSDSPDPDDAITQPWGSYTHPIDVDLFPTPPASSPIIGRRDTPIPRVGILRGRLTTQAQDSHTEASLGGNYGDLAWSHQSALAEQHWASDTIRYQS